MIALVVSVVTMVAVVAFLVGVLARSIRNERQTSGLRKVWANFALSLVLCILFFSSRIAQGLSQWDQFVADQRTHQPVRGLHDLLHGALGEGAAPELEADQVGLDLQVVELTPGPRPQRGLAGDRPGLRDIRAGRPLDLSSHRLTVLQSRSMAA